MSRIKWPNGARCAAAITFDMDADSLIHVATKDGWRRSYPVSMGRYGPTVAIPRIVETYRRLGLKQSFFIPYHAFRCRRDRRSSRRNRHVDQGCISAD